MAALLITGEGVLSGVNLCVCYPHPTPDQEVIVVISSPPQLLPCVTCSVPPLKMKTKKADHVMTALWTASKWQKRLSEPEKQCASPPKSEEARAASWHQQGHLFSPFLKGECITSNCRSIAAQPLFIVVSCLSEIAFKGSPLKEGGGGSPQSAIPQGSVSVASLPNAAPGTSALLALSLWVYH